jgi:transcriptional regulator with XRE-family HTH domain
MAMKIVDRDKVLARFSQNVNTLRSDRGIDQEQLAEGAMIHRTQVSYLEWSHRAPRLLTIVCLAGALDGPAADLFDGIAFVPVVITPSAGPIVFDLTEARP